MLFVPEDIPAKLIGSEKFPIGSFYVELTWKGQRWLINCSHNSSKVLIGQHYKLLSKNLDLQSSKYERFVFVDDFNVRMEKEAIKDFCNLYRLISLKTNQLVTKTLQIHFALTLY